MNHPMKVAVIGVTGLVGREFLRILAERDFPVTELFLYSSVRSSGSVIKFRDAEVKVRQLNHHNFRRADLALFSAGAAADRKWADPFAESGALVIDNSSAF
ncbi:MAG: aspartate-semialdehyde dehydrogenase, partial [FCB group bacterium]|nr:aspartate-semialdehyde dehydrogenase [FCB group bacterium]